LAAFIGRFSFLALAVGLLPGARERARPSFSLLRQRKESKRNARSLFTTPVGNDAQIIEIADRLDVRISKEGKALLHETIAGSNAAIGVIQQAYNTKNSRGGDVRNGFWKIFPQVLHMRRICCDEGGRI